MEGKALYICMPRGGRAGQPRGECVSDGIITSTCSQDSNSFDPKRCCDRDCIAAKIKETTGYAIAMIRSSTDVISQKGNNKTKELQYRTRMHKLSTQTLRSWLS